MTLIRRKPKAPGIPRGIRREFHKHRAFVRRHACCVPGCEERRIEFAHIRSAATAGTGLKPPDWMGVSLCHVHHHSQHDHGAQTFERTHGIDLAKLAQEFAHKSPDLAMREAMKEDMRMERHHAG